VGHNQQTGGYLKMKFSSKNLLRAMSGLFLVLGAILSVQANANSQSDRYYSQALPTLDASFDLIDSITVNGNQIKNSKRLIPQSFIKESQCVAIFPRVVRASLLVGKYKGQGVVMCNVGSKWSDVLFVELRGASLGIQAGYAVESLVILLKKSSDWEVNVAVRNELENSPIYLASDISVSFGKFETGRHSVGDFTTDALAYVGSKKGLHIGASFGGAVIAPQKDLNDWIYKRSPYSRYKLNQILSTTGGQLPEMYAPHEGIEARLQ